MEVLGPADTTLRAELLEDAEHLVPGRHLGANH
jgi:hypothetical protein